MEKETHKLTIQNNRIEILSRYDGLILVDVYKLPLTRSQAQNRFYWGFILPTVKEYLVESGYTVNLDDTHEICKHMFNRKKIESQNNIFEFAGSTAKMTKDDFSCYILKIENFLIENFNFDPSRFEIARNEYNNTEN